MTAISASAQARSSVSPTSRAQGASKLWCIVLGHHGEAEWVTAVAGILGKARRKDSVSAPRDPKRDSASNRC